jgi:hypothetical protein
MDLPDTADVRQNVGGLLCEIETSGSYMAEVLTNFGLVLLGLLEDLDDAPALGG